jgi:hypothetical protein
MWSKCFFVVDEAELHRWFLLQSQNMKHTIFSYREILSLNNESHIPGLMAGLEQEIIPDNHKHNEPQRYSSDESSGAYDSDNGANYANDGPNVNFTFDEDS